MKRIMRVKGEFILRKIAGDDVAVPIGQNIADFNGAVLLNETAVLLWKMLQEGCTRESLKDSLCSEYGIDERKAYEDVDKFLSVLEERGILEE